MSIDPRLEERRKVVAEQIAQRNVGRLLRFLLALVIAGAVAWLLFSPWLSVNQLEIAGIATSDAHAILARHRIIAGTPMILISAGRAEVALEEDPWIVEASVYITWPDRIVVEVTERSPIAWTRTESGWTRRAIDGVALPSEVKPDGTMARVELPELNDEEAVTAADMLGALAFVDALPERLHQGTVVTTHDNELWATVTGFQVRLGRPVEMREKALSLTALLAEGIPESSIVVLIAPTNPATMTPGTVAETVSEQGDETEGEGLDGP
jgi:cell division protein FtsQ